MEPDQTEDQTVQNDSAEVRLSALADQDVRAMYRLNPLTSGMELQPDPRQMSELTAPELVLSNHLDKPKPTAEPDLTWVVRFPKTVMTSLFWAVWCVLSVLKTKPTDCLSCPTH